MEVSLCLLLASVALGSAAVPASSSSNDLNPERQRRSFNLPVIGSLFGEEEEEPEIPHLGKYPLWKVHRYHGISLQPIPLPEEEIPLHPVAPTHDEEAPSIVNVPDPHYAPKEPVPLPPNEYGPPANPPSAPYPAPSPPSGPYPAPSPPSAPYPPQNAPSGPYPPPSSPSGPYPPPSSPSGPYPPPSSPSGPYSPASSPPSAPYPPVHNAHLSYDKPRGHSHVEASSVEFNGPPSDSHFVDILSHLGGGGNIEGGLSGLLSVLPPDVVQKLQQYISTPEGHERVSALLGIATNAKKLKVGAARSLQDIFNRLFGGAGGSTNVALQSGTYTNIPHPYPAPQGILNAFKAVGTGVSGSLLPTLPEPDLPKIPGLGPLPDTPALPHINLPDGSNINTKGLTGHYVSISLPQPTNTYVVPDAHSYAAPVDSYGLPADSYSPPADSYAPPADSYAPPTNSYGPPAQTYGTPYQASQAPQVPSTSYGSPAGPTYPYQPPTQQPANFHAPQHHGFDHTASGSEVHEEFHPRNNGQKEEAEKNPPVPLKTTKLQPVQNSQTFQGEDLRRYLDVDHPAAFKPSEPLEQEQEEEGDLLEEGEE